MGLPSTKKFNSLDELFLEQLQDLYDAEKRLVKALPKMADAATNPRLKEGLSAHLKETEVHCNRLETIFKELGKEPERETCDAMKGLIKEGEDMIEAKGDNHVKDAALIAAAQRVEHYEMAGYGTVRNFARQLGHQQAAELLQQTLDEESATDEKLTELAEAAINPQAAAAK